MATLTMCVCDRCGTKVMADRLTARWHRIVVKAGTEPFQGAPGVPLLNDEFDLCGDCFEGLHDRLVAAYQPVSAAAYQPVSPAA